MKGKETMRNKYICNNCGTGQARKHVEAMVKGGFALHNIACKDCGQNAVAKNEKE